MLRKRRPQTGVRPFDPSRDLGPVAGLIAAAFKGQLGPDGEIALARMQRVARWSPLLGWLYWPGWDRTGSTPGFVWVEQGRIVGNISLRRALVGRGFFIGNVAVHPNWRGRGIASALIEAALEVIATQGGRWVGLEVDADNRVARRLYERRGFQEVGSTLHMLRSAGLSWSGGRVSHPSLRRGCSRDKAELIRIVRALVPGTQRQLLELREENYRPSWERALARIIEGRREAWWVVEQAGTVHGAVRVARERGRRPDRLELLVDPAYEGSCEDLLTRQGLSSLRGVSNRMIETLLPMPTEQSIAALETCGFRRLRVLIQMQLDLGCPIPLNVR